MVIANNAIRLREIQSAVLEDDNVFGNIESVLIATINRVLRRNEISMKYTMCHLNGTATE